jgi:hypothetical protein
VEIGWLWSWYVKKPAPLPSPWTTLRPNTTTTCTKQNIGTVIGYLRRSPSCGEYRKASSLEWAARWPSLVALLLLALRSYLCGTQGKSHRTIISSRASSQNYSPSLEALAAIAPLMRATKLLMAAELDRLPRNKLRCPRANLAM